MTGPDDSALDAAQLANVRSCAAKLLRDASALGRFPTPIDDIGPCDCGEDIVGIIVGPAVVGHELLGTSCPGWALTPEHRCGTLRDGRPDPRGFAICPCAVEHRQVYRLKDPAHGCDEITMATRGAGLRKPAPNARVDALIEAFHDMGFRPRP